MTDYTELVKALRSASTVSTAWEKLMHDAAAAIEALIGTVGDLQAIRERLEEENDALRLEPKRGEWIVREVDSPGEMHPVAFRCMCSICRNEYLFPRIPRYCPDCGSMNTAKMEVQE